MSEASKSFRTFQYHYDIKLLYYILVYIIHFPIDYQIVYGILFGSFEAYVFLTSNTLAR